MSPEVSKEFCLIFAGRCGSMGPIMTATETTEVQPGPGCGRVRKTGSLKFRVDDEQRRLVEQEAARKRVAEAVVLRWALDLYFANGSAR